MVPGDLVTVTTDAGFFAVLELIPITGRIDIESNSISGVMEGPVFPALGEYWISRRDGTDGYGERFLIDDPGALSPSIWMGYSQPRSGINLKSGTPIPTATRWEASSGRQKCMSTTPTIGSMCGRTPRLTCRLRSKGKRRFRGLPEATAGSGRTTTIGDWNPPGQPDIVEGDVVTVTADGYTAAINPIGSIVGTVDLVENLVAGTLNAPFAEPLMVYCEVWVENGPSIEIPEVDPNGGGFSCDFDDVGWDIHPGQEIGLVYVEPDGDHVMNVIPVPFARATPPGIRWTAGLVPG